MPSTTSSVVSMVRDSSTVMTPSLPTFFMASAMILPTCLSVLALMVPTCAIMSPFTSRESFLISSTATSTALSMPRLSAIGLAPAATVRTPSRKIAWASTVAVLVPSPAPSELFGQEMLLLGRCRFGDSADFHQDFLLAEDQILLVVDLDVLAGVFAEQDPVTHLHIEWHTMALFNLAGSDSDYFALLRLFFGRVRDDYASFRGLLLFQPPYQHAVM